MTQNYLGAIMTLTGALHDAGVIDKETLKKINNFLTTGTPLSQEELNKISETAKKGNEIK